MNTSRTSRRRVAGRSALVVALVAVIVVACAVAAVVGATSGRPRASAATGTATTSSEAPSADASETTATGTGPSTSSAAPRTPQPTKSAALTSPQAIVKALTVSVTSIEAVKGVADGPGEIAGPALRFTVQIANDTGKRVDLSSAVVNAYSGSKAVPAIPLDGPGGRDFPTWVRNGASVRGVFVFNIPTEQRGRILLTVDTGAKNPLVAFDGAALR